MTLERGTILKNRYRIVEILGEGGMGAVYRAVDENLKVTVAVKENLFATEEYIRQFRVEATILASLRHPNLPRVTDHFEIEGESQYLIMDYVRGEDLRDRMDRLGMLDEKEVAIIGIAICKALAYLHTRQPPVLHRDIKPGNVKIAPDGNVFLVDFGLAKLVQGTQVTITGARAMTPGYSPPEQYGTARTDVRSDIYSLGATLYSALTGTLPEDGLARAMNQVELTPIRKRNPKSSRKIAAAIEKALAVQPDDRYQTAEEFERALIAAQSITRRRPTTGELTLPPPPQAGPGEANRIEVPQESPQPPTGPKRGSGPKPASPILPVSRPVEEPAFESVPVKKGKSRLGCLLWLFILLLVFGGGGAYAYFQYPHLAAQALAFIVAPPATGTVPALETASPTATPLAPPTEPVEPAASPTSLPTPSPTPSATPPPTPTPTPTPSPTEPLVLQPTPPGGGSKIAFASDRTGAPQVWIMNTDGSSREQITNLPQGACQPDWSPEGAQIIFISPCAGEQEDYPDARLYVIDLASQEITPLPTAGKGDYDPAWSPLGDKILFTSLRGGKPQIFVLTLGEEQATLLAGEGLKNIHPAWSPTGDQIVFVSTRRGPYQIWTMKPDGAEQTLSSRSGDLKNTGPSWSSDGQTLVFTQRQLPTGLPYLVSARLADAGLFETRLAPTNNAPMRSADLSPDAAWVVFEGWPDGENHDIYIMRLNGEDLTRLTEAPAFDFDASWQPAP